MIYWARGQFIHRRAPRFAYHRHAGCRSHVSGTIWTVGNRRQATFQHEYLDTPACVNAYRTYLQSMWTQRTSAGTLTKYLALRWAGSHGTAFEYSDYSNARLGTVRVKPGEYVCVNSDRIASPAAVGPRHAHETMSILLADSLCKELLAGLGLPASAIQRLQFDHKPRTITPSLRQALELLPLGFGERYALGASPLVQSGATQLLTFLLYEHPSTLSREVQDRSVQLQRDPRVDRAVAFLQERYSEPITISALLKEIPMSRSHLLARFHQETGLTPKQMLLTIRIQRAKHLLRTTAKSVEQIAEESGFGRADYFTAVFTRQVRQTPSQYRKI